MHFSFSIGAKKPNKDQIKFKINSIVINATHILKTEEDLKPLADAMPDDKEQRKR